PPDDLAGPLVEGDEPAAADGLFAPAGVEHAQDEQVAVDDRAGDPAAVAADPAVLLGQGVLPEDLAVLVEAEEEPLGAVGVDVAGLGVAHHVRPAEADGDDVGVPDVELVLPEGPAGVGVEAHDPLLQVQPRLLGVPLAAGLVDDVDPAVLDDGGAAA